MNALSKIPEKHHPVLERYRRSLPDYEYRALECWLTTFYPFQLDWILEQSRRAVCNGSRQTGKSHTTAGVGVLWGAFHGELTTFISKGEKESKEVLLKSNQHRKVLMMLGSKMAAPGTVDNSTETDFKSGGRIMALPSSGGRGFSGNVFLDEFAYHQRPEEVWDACLPVIMHGYRARVASTPNGAGNLFHSLLTDPVVGKGWVKHECSLQRALDDGMKVDVEECWGMAQGDPRLFGQMFECKFLNGELQYIPTEMVENACEPAPTEAPPRKTSGPAFAGLDIGRNADRTELYVIQKGEDERWHVVHQDSCKRTSGDDIRNIVGDAFGRFDVRGLGVDATGLGTFPAEELQRIHGEDRVIALNITLQSKEKLATGLYQILRTDELRIPKDDKTLFSDICSIQRLVTTAGNVKYESPRTAKGHGDSAWALALAVYAKSQLPVFNYGAPSDSVAAMF